METLRTIIATARGDRGGDRLSLLKLGIAVVLIGSGWLAMATFALSVGGGR